MAEQPTEPLALVCPYCGSGLVVTTETVGPAYLTYERPESIECDAFSDVHCAATWEPDGTPRDAPEWVRYPGLYSRREGEGQRPAPCDATVDCRAPDHTLCCPSPSRRTP